MKAPNGGPEVVVPNVPTNGGIAATGGQIYGPSPSAPTGASDNPGPTDSAIQSQADQMGQTVPSYVSAGFKPPAVVDSSAARDKTQKNQADLAAANAPAPTLGESGMTVQQQMDAADKQMGRGKYAPGAATEAVDQVQADADAAISQLDQYASRLSARQQEAIKAIQESYAQRRAAQADTNKRLMDYTTKVGIKTGAQRYAPNVQAGILSGEESAGLARISKLNAEENSLILQANQAADDQNFKLLNQRMEMLSNTRKEKAQAIQTQLENAQKQDALERQKKIDQQAIEKANIDMIDKFAETGMEFASLPVETSKALDTKFGEGFTQKYLNYRKLQGPKPIEIDGNLIQKQPDGTYKAVFTSPVDPKAATGDIGQFLAYQQMTPAEQAAFNKFNKDNANLKDKATNMSGLDSMTANAVDKIANLFDSQPITKKFNTILEAKNYTQSIPTGTLSPAEQQGLVYAFAKAMDPDSSVREGEYATIQKYGDAWATQMGYNLDRALSLKPTAFLSPEAIKNLKDAINTKYQANKGQYENLAKEFARRIDRKTGNTDGLDYLTNFAGADVTSSGSKPVSPEDLQKAYEKLNPGGDFKKALEEDGADAIQQDLEAAGANFTSDLSMSGKGSNEDSLATTKKVGMRTDRHNNPAAFTTDVARVAGLVKGVDYEVGDPFDEGRYHTARLLKDPVGTTIKVIDKIGFQTQSGNPRWSYINIPKAEWDAMSFDKKKATIKKMYGHEGGSQLKNLFT
jgi:hypothetical protein